MDSLIRHCEYCGPRKVIVHTTLKRSPNEIACPTCGLDPLEIMAIEKVRSLGFEECYRQEVQANSAR